MCSMGMGVDQFHTGRQPYVDSIVLQPDHLSLIIEYVVSTVEMCIDSN